MYKKYLTESNKEQAFDQVRDILKEAGYDSYVDMSEYRGTIEVVMDTDTYGDDEDEMDYITSQIVTEFYENKRNYYLIRRVYSDGNQVNFELK